MTEVFHRATRPITLVAKQTPWVGSLHPDWSVYSINSSRGV